MSQFDTATPVQDPSLAAPSEADLPDLDDLDLDADAHPDDEPDAAPEAAAVKGAAPRTSNRALIRRVANKAQEILDADAVIRSVAATLVGSSDGLADLTTAIMTAERGVTQPITDLYAIAEADAFEAATVVGGLGRDRMKAVWSLLATFDQAPTTNVPTSNSKAALALAKHVIKELDIESLRKDLDAVSHLLRKN